MAEHVVILDPSLLTAREGRPNVSVAVEARDRPGPAYKHGVLEGDDVWLRMGPLLVAKGVVRIAWHGEYAVLRELRERTRGTELFAADAWWGGRPKVGYAVVARLERVRFLPEASLAGPRSYGYDWIVLDSERKRETWLARRPPDERDRDLVARFEALRGG